MLYTYNIKYWDTLDGQPKLENQHGFITGDDYRDAANKIVAFYGDGHANIEELTLSLRAENDAIELAEDLLNKVLEEGLI